jgi:glycosyltransferase involved in cell wall biosynthesis
MKKFLFIGSVNQGNPPLGGEEYKNQLLVNYFHSLFNLTVIDTIHWKKNPLILYKLIFNILFISYDKIIVSASSASTYKLIRFLNLFPRKLSKTYYFVIGGYFPEGLKSGKYKIDFYKGLKSIVVEGELLKNQILLIEKLVNVKVIPNFKEFDIDFLKIPKFDKKSIVKFVFISRISKSKGIDIILDAVNILKADGFGSQFQIDFYGKIENDFEHDFFQNIDNSQLNYRGYLNLMNETQEAYNMLMEYDVMLFPTYWMGEGFPGVIIDAYIAGLPVIASDWNMNKELIEDGITGKIIPSRDVQSLVVAMKEFILDRESIVNMGLYARASAHKFHIKEVAPLIINLLND